MRAAIHGVAIGARGLVVCAAAILMWSAGGDAQAPGRVVRLDPGLDAIVAADATIEKVASGVGFAEGPVWMRDGTLVFSDIPGNAIMKMTASGELSVLRKPGGFDGTGAKPGSHIGSNGLTLDRQDRLIIAEHGNRRITRLEANGTITVLADRYDGKRLNSPNDVAVRSDGSVYFTDPPYGLPAQDTDPAKELMVNGVFRIRDGKVDLLSSELTRPNGLAFSPDERFLFVANSDQAKRIWMRYEVRQDGTLANGAMFYDVTADAGRGIPDGLKVDARGNLFGTGPGGVWIVSPERTPLGRIELPELPANVAFGGTDGRTLYMTARTSVYRVQLKAAGPRPCCR